MKLSRLALVPLLVCALSARAEFAAELAAGAAAARATAKASRPERVAGCVATSETPLAAVNQDKRVPAGVKMAVDIRQPTPFRVEIRVAGLPAGAGPFPGSPYAAKIAGIMISELGADGHWLVGLVASESGGGARSIKVWQITSRIGEPSRELEIDLAAEGSRALKFVAPSKNGDVTLDVACYTDMRAAK